MSDQPPSNVKIYDRPDSKKPSPVVMVIALLVVVLLAFGIYKWYSNSHASTPAPAGLIVNSWNFAPKVLLR